MDKKGGVTFFRRSFYPQIAQKSSWANPSVFQNYSGFKIFWIIGSSQFCQFFCLTSPKIIVSEPVCVSELFWYQNVLENRGITILSIVFFSQCRKICGEPSNDSKKLGHPKKLCTKEEFNDFQWIILVSQYREASWGERFCLSEKF